jgi:serine/threonine-protein kinase
MGLCAGSGEDDSEALTPVAQIEVIFPRIALSPNVITKTDPRPSLLQSELLVIERLLHYRITEKIGEGGMGVVYRAFDERLDRYVAIKMLLPGAVAAADRRRVVQEAKTTSSINHPNIVTIYDVTSSDGNFFIVMELVEGTPLHHTASFGTMGVAEFIRIASQIADGVSGAHEHSVIHRDLKPSNILVTPEKRVKILDFGVAKLIRPISETDVTLTQEGKVAGTVGYMSPEQIAGGKISAASDVFSMGIVFFEMLTGKRPFRGETAGAVMGAILHKEPVALSNERPGLPIELERLIFLCLRKDPQHRTETAASVHQALESIRSGLTSGGSVHSVSRLKALDPAAPALVVLPFNNLTSDKENDYFSDGLAEEIINALTRVPKLRVTARASAFAFRGSDYNIEEIGAKLKVDYILEGGVRRVHDRLRVTVNLIKVSDGVQLWSERYDRMMTDIFEVQDEISAAVAEKLRVHLAGEATQELEPVKRANVEAYKLYLKGRFYWNRRSGANLRRGIECFSQALEIEPVYAEPWVGLADSYNLLGYYAGPPKDLFPKARHAAEKALEIDPVSAGAHASLGFASLFYDWDWAKADREFKLALHLDPDNSRAHHWRAWYYFAARRTKEAVASMQHAHDRDPLAPIVNDHLAFSYSLAGMNEKALHQLRQAIDLDNSFFLSHYWMGWVYLAMNDPVRAIAPLQRSVELSESKTGLGLLGFALGRANRGGEAVAAERKLLDDEGHRFVSPLELALVRAGAEDNDGAFRCLDDAVRERTSELVLFLSYPWPPSVRSDPRFDTIADLIGLRKFRSSSG